MTAKWNRAALAQVREGVVAGLRAGGELLFEATQQAVPVDTGDLKRSGHLDVDPAALKATIRYDTEYAVIVHEKTELHHKNGSAKYVETPVNARKAAALNAVAAEIRRHAS